MLDSYILFDVVMLTNDYKHNIPQILFYFIFNLLQNKKILSYFLITLNFKYLISDHVYFNLYNPLYSVK